ncbi:hypothetical protein AB0G04_06810 [Actinoplanes sp. NPDC023801]|uniref:hypothetical protein n=1 Tax=Actinoplanes sp. NPDC023801 TaxID=3154595 RepID=UPI0034014460
MLRDALHTIAGRAHDPGPVAARVAARARAHRQRRGLLVASAAAVAGAGAAVAVRPRTPGPDLPRVTPTASGPPAGTRAPLAFRPGRLPAGFAEIRRMGTVPGSGPVSQTRTWQRGTDPEDMVHLFLVPRSQFDTFGFESLTLGGRRAWANAGPGKIWVEVDEKSMVSVSVGRSDRTGRLAREIAASIEPDPGAGVAVSLSFGWLPDRFTGPVSAELSGTADRWQEILRMDRAIQAELVWEVSTSKGEPVTLRGRPGWIHPGDPDAGCPDLPGNAVACRGMSAFARIDLGQNRLLRVLVDPGATVNRTELVRITEELTLGPEPDTAWLPRR